MPLATVVVVVVIVLNAPGKNKARLLPTAIRSTTTSVPRVISELLLTGHIVAVNRNYRAAIRQVASHDLTLGKKLSGNV